MVVAPHPTTEWSSLQDVFYRKTELYALNWGIENLADYVAAAASNGGLIALIRDPNRLVSLGKASMLRPKILVYTAAGQLIESLPWDPSVRIVALGFNALEQLVVVLEEGSVRLYTLMSPCPAATSQQSASSGSSSRPQPVEATSNAYYVQYSLGPEATETGIVQARVWAGGLVALVGAGRFVQWRFPGLDADPDSSDTGSGIAGLAGGGEFGYTFASFDDDSKSIPQPELLPPPYPSSTTAQGDRAASNAPLPTSWAVVPPAASVTGLTTVLFARDSTLYSLTRSTAGPNSLDTACQDMRLSRGPFHAIRPSPNGKLLALLTADLVLWVVSSDFSRSFTEFDVRASEAYEDATPVEGGLNLFDGAEHGKGGLGGSGIRSVEWCGNNTVALAFNDEVMMVGPFGDSIRYPYPGPVHLVGEVDGLRVISTDRYEFLQKVPEVSTKIFQPGSNDPAALLFDAAEQFVSKSSKADEGIRAIRSSLPEAVDTCLRAAAYEWDLTWQKRLLKAASFGKGFIDLHDPTSFVDMAKTLRVLNAARDYQVGIPISYDQYVAAGERSLLSRFTAQNHHLLALRIAHYLHVRPDPILKHWARSKIARSKPPLGASAGAISASEERLCAEIVRKFQLATLLNEQVDGLGGQDEAGQSSPQPETRTSAAADTAERGVAISFSEVAWTAWKAGRRNLATRLLDHEARAIDQVPLLLNMHEDKLALVKAIESGDTDLIYHVLLRLKLQLSRGDFFRIVQAPISDATLASLSVDAGRDASPSSVLLPARQYLALASNLLESYARETDRDLLRDFYYQDDRRTDSALLALDEAHLVDSQSMAAATTTTASEDLLAEKTFKLKSAMKFFSEDKERVLEAKLVDEQIRLLGFQHALEKEDGHRARFVGLSLNETIRELLYRNMPKKVDKLRSDFKVPDKRFWNLKIQALVQTKDWDGLWTFGMLRSPRLFSFSFFFPWHGALRGRPLQCH
ncbi:hypothetical protein BCV70DRAFT_234108 [Testicularia cyperi]|uniref:Vacuolar protein sorting-associated protein 16 homolog n=1 Tax=Testicularia cyperi TaxID=1882483 RepID=A0A317XFL4_9BASI|nr:hypothetical protein BCV70DRAFT_234108 [Testicularia cyperi]